MDLTKNSVLFLALIATLAMTWYVSQQDANEDVALPTRVTNQHRVATKAMTQAYEQSMLKPVKRPFVEAQGDLFSVPQARAKLIAKSASQAVHKSKLMAPPLPFRYLGRWEDQSVSTVSLEYQGEVVIAKVGETIGDYRVVAMSDVSNGFQIQFLMIPFNQLQIMHVGTTQ